MPSYAPRRRVSGIARLCWGVEARSFPRRRAPSAREGHRCTETKKAPTRHLFLCARCRLGEAFEVPFDRRAARGEGSAVHLLRCRFYRELETSSKGRPEIS